MHWAGTTLSSGQGNVFSQLAGHVMVRMSNSQLRGRWFDFQGTALQSCSHTRASVTKQYNQVLAKGRWCSAAGKDLWLCHPPVASVPTHQDQLWPQRSCRAWELSLSYSHHRWVWFDWFSKTELLTTVKTVTTLVHLTDRQMECTSRMPESWIQQPPSVFTSFCINISLLVSFCITSIESFLSSMWNVFNWTYCVSVNVIYNKNYTRNYRSGQNIQSMLFSWPDGS